MKPDSRITTVLFDLDDTLIDSLRAREDTVRRVFQARGITLAHGWKLANLRGLVVKDILRQSGIKEDELETQYLSYRRIYWTQSHTPIKLYKGVRSMLEKLHQHGIKMGIVTTKGRDFFFEGHRAGAIIELERTNILHLFGVVIGFEDVEQTKPDPEGINLALERLHSRPEETLYVGDSLADMLAAQEAGCLTCHAHWGVTKLEGFKADYSVSTPRQLLELLIR